MTFTKFYILLLSLFLYLAERTLSEQIGEEARLREYNELQDELNRAYRNAPPCNKKKDKPRGQIPNVPNLETRAVLVKCPNFNPCAVEPSLRRGKEQLCDVKEHEIKQFHGFDEDEPVSELSLTNCRFKLMLTIRISKHQFDSNRNQYIIVDHVYDPVTAKYSRLFTPYVIKFKQEPTMQLYELKFMHVVNAKVHEQVYSKRSEQNYTGCDVTSLHPTCGKIMYKGKIVPYSAGFCCSCDQYTNYMRQPVTIQQYSFDNINYGDPAYLLGGIECPRNVRGQDAVNTAQDLLSENKENPNRPDQEQKVVNPEAPWESPLRKMKYHPPKNTKQPSSPNKFVVDILKPEYQSQLNFHRGQARPKRTQLSSYNDHVSVQEKPMDNVNDRKTQALNEEIENLKSVLKIRKSISNRLYRRQVQVGGTQRRGGQNCADRYTPKNVNKVTYHESTHCLRFSDLWYTVYRFQAPIVEHAISFQIFEKQTHATGMKYWEDITKFKKARVSTLTPTYLHANKTFSIRFVPQTEDIDPASFALNYKAAVLLVPEDLSEETAKKLPQTRGGGREYLVLHAGQITLEGDQCNLAGVGFEAFFKQPNRCAKSQGACLRNQPYDLWLHDHQAEKENLQGCFFLKHFGEVPDQPIRHIKGRPSKYLFLEYDHPHVSKLNLEIKADYNVILRKESTAKITEVYTDNGNRGKIAITVKVTNSGLTSSKFMIKMTDCALEIPTLFNNLHSEKVLIPPQHQHVFTLVINCELPAERFHCSIEALNVKNVLVALRRIRLQKYDRCVCAWHCLCACTGSAEGLGCAPMSLMHYRAAGFQGSLPVTSYTIHYSFFDDALSLLLYIFMSLIFILLTLGLSKALLGLFCCPIIGILGLSVILDLPKRINKYYEHDLKQNKVIYDEDGWPIHPKTKKRARDIPVSTEVCMNVVFFIVYPFTIALLLIKRVRGSQSDEMRREPTDVIPCINDYEGYHQSKRQPSREGSLLRKRSSSKSTKNVTSESGLRLSTIISIQEGEESSENTDSELMDEEEIIRSEIEQRVESLNVLEEPISALDEETTSAIDEEATSALDEEATSGLDEVSAEDEPPEDEPPEDDPPEDEPPEDELPDEDLPEGEPPKEEPPEEELPEEEPPDESNEDDESEVE